MVANKMERLYISSHPSIISDYGYEPLPTIYKDSSGDTIYVTEHTTFEGLRELEEIQLTQGMESKGILIFKTHLNDNELA